MDVYSHRATQTLPRATQTPSRTLAHARPREQPPDTNAETTMAYIMAH